MKKYLYIFVVLAGFQISATAQDCDSLVTICESYLDQKDGGLFISDGQVYQAFLTEEAAEFETTLYGGSTYRVVTSAGIKDNFVVFSIIDEEGTVLFTNEKYKNAKYWDFKVESTINCKIELKLDLERKSSGCVTMLIGFKK
jgi:hypothetical protein